MCIASTKTSHSIASWAFKEENTRGSIIHDNCIINPAFYLKLYDNIMLLNYFPLWIGFVVAQDPGLQGSILSNNLLCITKELCGAVIIPQLSFPCQFVPSVIQFLYNFINVIAKHLCVWLLIIIQCSCKLSISWDIRPNLHITQCGVELPWHVRIIYCIL